MSLFSAFFGLFESPISSIDGSHEWCHRGPKQQNGLCSGRLLSVAITVGEHYAIRNMCSTTGTPQLYDHRSGVCATLSLFPCWGNACLTLSSPAHAHLSPFPRKSSRISPMRDYDGSHRHTISEADCFRDRSSRDVVSCPCRSWSSECGAIQRKVHKLQCESHERIQPHFAGLFAQLSW